MKKILILILSAALTNCATKENKSEVKIEDGLSVSNAQQETSAKEPAKPSKAPGSPEEFLDAALKKQNDNEIFKAAQDVLLINPNHVKSLNAISMVYYKQGKYKAANYFNKLAIKESPNTSGLYNNAGLISLALNEQREAITHFKKGYELNSSDAAIGANLGALYVMNKDFTNAEFALEAAVKKGTKDTKILNNYAIALSANKKFDEATKIYERALKEQSNSRDIMLNYSIHLIENLKKNQEGLDLLNRLKFVGPPSEARNLIKDLENKAKAGLK